MTGYIEDPGITMPLSRVTIASLADLGYMVPPPLGDVLWQYIDGIVATGVGELGDAPDGFETQEIGDFDGDGDSDILWRNDVGAVLTWELENGEFAVEHIQPNAPIAWQVAGTGDFDGDGDHEILWQHNEGAVTIWEMEGGNYEVNHNQPNVGTTWGIAGTGDSDGDNDADILWRHEEGAVTIWEMEDNAYMVNHNQPFASNFYQIAGTGDFDGDADDDILWRGEDGQVVTWEMEGGNYEVNHNQPSAPTTWEIEGTHDFDHDGDDDTGSSIWCSATPSLSAARSLKAVRRSHEHCRRNARRAARLPSHARDHFSVIQAGPALAKLPEFSGAKLPTLAPLVREITPSVVNLSAQGRIKEDNPFYRDPLFREFFDVPEQLERKIQVGCGTVN